MFSYESKRLETTDLNSICSYVATEELYSQCKTECVGCWYDQDYDDADIDV